MLYGSSYHSKSASQKLLAVCVLFGVMFKWWYEWSGIGEGFSTSFVLPCSVMPVIFAALPSQHNTIYSTLPLIRLCQPSSFCKNQGLSSFNTAVMHLGNLMCTSHRHRCEELTSGFRASSRCMGNALLPSKLFITLEGCCFPVFCVCHCSCTARFDFMNRLQFFPLWNVHTVPCPQSSLVLMSEGLQEVLALGWEVIGVLAFIKKKVICAGQIKRLKSFAFFVCVSEVHGM